jgi:hypothetical protein
VVELNEMVDVQDIGIVSLTALPEPVVEHDAARWQTLDNKHIIGYSLYQNGVRMNHEIITASGFAAQGEVSLKPVFSGGYETVLSSHGMQSGSDPHAELHYAFNVVSNPSLNHTRMVYSVPEQTPVTIAIYDISGRQVKYFDRGMQKPGQYALFWNGADERGRAAPAGVYFIRFATEARVEQKKILLLR